MKKIYPKYTPNISQNNTWYPKLPSYFWPKFTIIWILSHRHQFYQKVSLELEINLRWLLLEDLFCSTQKMHISEYVFKTCLKELGTFFKCRETFEITDLPQFFFKGFWQLYFKNINFLTKTKRCLYAECYEFKTKMTGKDKQNHIFQKSKSYEISSTILYICDD